MSWCLARSGDVRADAIVVRILRIQAFLATAEWPLQNAGSWDEQLNFIALPP